MIVNPQLFNYRLIIGSLIIAVAILTVYSFTSYKSIVAHQQFLEQEKKLVESELSQMITRYDDVLISSDLLSNKLKDAKLATKLALDSLKMLRSDLSVLARFKQQLFDLKLKNKSLFKTLDSLDQVNKDLKAEKQLAYKALNKERLEKTSLLEKNEDLNKSIEEGALLTANSFDAKALKKSLGSKRPTTKAKRVKTIEVSFVLAKNSLTEAGKKDIYVQILNPSNNVVADKGSIDFGTSTLIYSEKQVIDYNNKVIEVNVNVDADIDEQPLEKGMYYISIFHNERKLGSTQMRLN